MLSRDVPEDVAMEILSRLPVKSLMRFKTARKSWNALIRDPNFITKHRTWAASHNPHREVLLKPDCRPTLSILSNETLEVSGDIDLSPIFPEKINEILIFGPCYGVLCLVGISFHRGYEIVLWNPATRESKMLPIMHLHLDPRLFGCDFGFGIDVKTGDYKVVQIRHYLDNKQVQVQVYNLSTDSWRVIKSSLSQYRYFRPTRFPSYLNGFHYWWGGMVFSFDMSNEVFQEILPPPVERATFEDIAIINDSLTLVLIYTPLIRRVQEEWCNLWVMNESGVERTWTKTFTIRQPGDPTEIRQIGDPEFFNLLHFREDGLVFLCRDPEDCLVLYDPRTQEQRKLEIFRPTHLRIVSYMETLVSVNVSRRENVLES